MSGLVLGQRDEPAGHRLSQEEILGSTRLVSQGLEALHSEHQAVLQSLSQTIECLQQEGHEEGLVMHEKARQLRRSMENIELGLSEAQHLVLTGFAHLGDAGFGQPPEHSGVGEAEVAGSGAAAVPGEPVAPGRAGRYPAAAAAQ
uniref:Kinesin light chain 4 n=1 Tax=Pipistrellus kuhlii TaxID=59472 RepID=A0A7J7YND9_PIPKU|nr:kinesin light chain 4 [Pipistrellus kuhlii]